MSKREAGLHGASGDTKKAKAGSDGKLVLYLASPLGFSDTAKRFVLPKLIEKLEEMVIHNSSNQSALAAALLFRASPFMSRSAPTSKTGLAEHRVPRHGLWT